MDNRYLIVCPPAEEAFFAQPEWGVSSRTVCSEEAFDALSEKDLTGYAGIIVTAELDWAGHAPGDFYGFDVAVALRLRLKGLAPMCILSFLPRDYFAALSDIKYNILKARGTTFERLPASPEGIVSAMNGILPLSQATLAYLSNLLVDIQHLLDHLRHVLRMTSSRDRIAEALRRTDILSSAGVYPSLRMLSDEILAAHDAGDEERFYLRTSELLDQLGTCRQQSGSGSAATEEGARQTVVIVDDNRDDLQWATSALQGSFRIVPFQFAHEAKQYIDNDRGNEIAAIICDWQLLEPGTEDHQEMLGFELLDYAARKGHYALFSLTSTDDSSTLEVDQHLWFEHTLITKDFHHDDALWRMYIPVIRQKIERTRAVIASLPSGDAWTSDFKLAYRKENGKNVAYKQYFTSLKEQYIQQRNSEDWHSFEAEVSTTADQLWAYYQKALSPDERPFLFDLKTQWGIELNRELKNVLVIRRLFLAFWFNKAQLDIAFKIPQKGIVEDPVINIYSVLRHRYFHELMEDRESPDALRAYKDLNNAAKVFANQLAIEPNRLPQGVLPEEKAWLGSLGIEAERGNDNLYYPED